MNDPQAFDLDGRVALVTGASRGVGAAAAFALASAGCRVACAARSTAEHPHKTPGTIDETVERIRAASGTAIAVPADLSQRDQVESMVETTVAELGGLDILVNNAAVTFVGDLDIPMRRHDLIMEINLNAPLVATNAAVPHMKASGEGRILNLSSVAAFMVVPGLMSYGTSKIALERMTVDAAAQLRPHNIAVNVFRIDVPVASEGFVANMPDADHSKWEPSEVAAEGIVWMLRQPLTYTGQREGMQSLGRRERIMESRVGRDLSYEPPTSLPTGIAGPFPVP